MNYVVETGNLTRDPEHRVVKGAGGKETTVVSFTIANSRRFKKKDGSPGEETYFFRCEAWDKGAETIAKYFKKGSPILVQGSLRNNPWVDKDGNKRSDTIIRVEHFEFFSQRKEESVNNDVVSQDEQPVSAGVGEEDIPF